MEAKLLGIHEKQLPQHMLEVSAATWIAGRIGLESFCRRLTVAIESGDVQPVCAYTVTLNDETPVTLRLEDEREKGTWLTAPDSVKICE